MKKILMLIIGITLISANGMAQAEMPRHDMKQMAMQPAGQAKHEGRGIIKAIKGNTVQLAHEVIPALHWSAMTMWFSLRVPLPAELKVGDNVRFELEQTEAQKWIIGKIERKQAGK